MHIETLMYDKLVKDEDDIIAIIAFGLYKKQEVSWLNDIKKRKTRAPTTEEFNDFYTLVSSEQQLNSYLDKATEISTYFVQEVLIDEMKKVEVDANNTIQDNYKEIENKYKLSFEQEAKKFNPSFMNGVWQSLIASVLFVLLIGVLFFFTWSFSKGPVDLLENIFNVKIIDAKEYIEITKKT